MISPVGDRFWLCNVPREDLPIMLPSKQILQVKRETERDNQRDRVTDRELLNVLWDHPSLDFLSV